MSATKEELEAEAQFNSRLIDGITSALIDLPQRDLSKWSYRCAIFTNLDAAIDSALASAETETVARGRLLMLVYKACDRLTAPGPLINAPKSKSAVAKEFEKRVAKIAKAKPGNG